MVSSSKDVPCRKFWLRSDKGAIQKKKLFAFKYNYVNGIIISYIEALKSCKPRDFKAEREWYIKRQPRFKHKTCNGWL